MNAVVQFQAPRLPYHPALEERFGVDRSSWKALVEAIFPSAETPDSVVMALAYCKARGLDVFKRPVHIVPVYDSKRWCMVETVWPGISELRTTAMRTSQYAGKDKTAFGPNLELDLDGVKITVPEWAQVTVRKVVRGVGVCVFEGPEVSWMEAYATAKRDTKAPNAMWRKRPRGQLDKCAEAAALRLAFPEELGGEYAAEEIEGQALGHVRDSAPKPSGMLDRQETRTANGGFDPEHVTAELDAALGGDQLPDHDRETGEVIEAEFEAVTDPNIDPPAPDIFPGDRPRGGADGGYSASEDFDPQTWCRDQLRQIDGAESVAALDAVRDAPDASDRFQILKRFSASDATTLQAAMTGKRKALADRERAQ